jgi:hypothetical protein
VRSGDCLGCERQGAREEVYRVQLTAQDLAAECNFPQEQWSDIRAGDRFAGQVGVVTSDVRCDDLVRISQP